MPTIINTTYFQNEPLFIPNSVTVPDIQEGNPSSGNKLAAAIERYEKLLLVSALGKEQYDLLTAGASDVDGKWFDLLNGKTYEGKYWPGLKDENSLIAYYVFYHYLANDRMQYTTVGLERSKSKNSVSVNPTEKLTEVWNTFVELYGYTPTGGLYGNYCPAYYLNMVYGYDTRQRGNIVSLLHFLSDFPDEYDTSYFARYAVKNRFGL